MKTDACIGLLNNFFLSGDPLDLRTGLPTNELERLQEAADFLVAELTVMLIPYGELKFTRENVRRKFGGYVANPKVQDVICATNQLLSLQNGLVHLNEQTTRQRKRGLVDLNNVGRDDVDSDDDVDSGDQINWGFQSSV